MNLTWFSVGQAQEHRFMKTLHLPAIALLLSAALALQAAATRPNIILVMTDDQGYGDLACHGHPFIQTPNLDKLHRESTRFTDFQVSATCSPTRAALLSGRHPFKCGVTHTLLEHNSRFVRTEGYCTDVFFDQALSWVHQNKDRPFFAYIPTNAPHLPYLVAEKYKQLYTGKCKDRPAAFLGMITNIDENMGRLMGKLDEWNLADNTLLVFMTDNGTSGGADIFNAGMKGRKATIHGGATRVPLFLKLPGRIKPGVDIDRLARHYDLFPTLADYAQVKVPAAYPVDGRSLKPLIDDPESEWPDRLTFFHLGRWAKKDAPPRFSRGNSNPDDFKLKKFAVRNQRWRLVGPDTLYDMQANPGEQHNVADQHPEVVKRMLQAYEAWWDEVRPLMINEDATLDTGKPFIERYRRQEKEEGIPLWKPAPGSQ